MDTKPLIKDISQLDTSLDNFFYDAQSVIINYGFSSLNANPIVYEEGWLVNIYHFKINENVFFIFTCVNKELKEAYAISSNNDKCPTFLIEVAKELYSKIKLVH